MQGVEFECRALVGYSATGLALLLNIQYPDGMRRIGACLIGPHSKLRVQPLGGKAR